jgi:hypothetical protein
MQTYWRMTVGRWELKPGHRTYSLGTVRLKFFWSYPTNQTCNSTAYSIQVTLGLQLQANFIIVIIIYNLPPWIRSFDLFRHRRVAIFSWDVHDLFSLEVCSWGRVSAVWCCPFFKGDWSSFVCVWISRLVFQRSLVFFLTTSLIILSNLVYPFNTS